jgi:hypothetical protein
MDFVWVSLLWEGDSTFVWEAEKPIIECFIDSLWLGMISFSCQVRIVCSMASQYSDFPLFLEA